MINKINFHNYLDKKIIIALSGGPDSVFLLIECLRFYNPENIIACHVNYNYRKDSINDLNICRKLCKLNKVKLEVLEINEDYSKLKINFESWARVVRYDFFYKIKEDKGFDLVFTGHNLNDFVESYLIQLDRKTNTDYFGIKKKVFINKLEVYRPLLLCLKSFILKKLKHLIKQNKIEEYAIDSTNSDPKYLRNKIRQNLKDKDVLKLKLIIDELNINKKNQNEIIKNLNYNSSVLNLNDLNNFDDELKLKIIYKFLINSKYKEQFINSKKQRTREFLKICKSNKTLVTHNFGNCFVIKDRNLIYLEDIFYSKNYELDNLNNEIAKRFDNINFLEKNYIKNIPYIFSNNWIKYKNFYLEKSKIKIVDIYKKRKVPYYLRYKNLLIIDINNKQATVSYFNKKEREEREK